jgi:DnaJ-class molecular chaperone
MPEMILKAENEGLPLIDDPSRRGNLFVKVHVAFPQALRLTDEEKAQLRKYLEPEKVDASLMNPRHSGHSEDEARAGAIPAPEQEFGMDADKSNAQPLLCKQM